LGGPTSLIRQPLGVSMVGDHLVLRDHDFVLEGRWLESGEEQLRQEKTERDTRPMVGSHSVCLRQDGQPYLTGQVDDGDQGGLRV
jgi:hypothetical protein